MASGLGGDPRFPEGTLAMQWPHFAALGLDLSEVYPATLNVSIAPLEYRVRRADHTFHAVKWCPTEPAEDFSFFACRVEARPGWIYYPHPETKPEHHQPPDVLEVLTTQIPGINYGDTLQLEIPADRIEIV